MWQKKKIKKKNPPNSLCLEKGKPGYVRAMRWADWATSRSGLLATIDGTMNSES